VQRVYELLRVCLLIEVAIRELARYARFLFFFQAEDGIRDFHVTGVQTCALPICRSAPARRCPRTPRAPERSSPVRPRRCAGPQRSEERRVGKECRSGRAPYHEKKKQTNGNTPIVGLTRPYDNRRHARQSRAQSVI